MATVKSYYFFNVFFFFYKRRQFEKSRNVTHRNVSEKERVFTSNTRKESLSVKENRKGRGKGVGERAHV